MASPADGTPSTRREARAAAQRAHDAARVPAANVSPHAAGPATIVPLEDLFAADAGARARDERDRRDRRKSRTAAWLVFGAILALLGGLAAAGFQVWNTYEDDIRGFMGWEEPKDYDAGTATGDVTVTIVTGDTGSSISRTLFESGVTKTADAFYDYLISSAQDPTFLPGVYSLQQQMTSAAALDALLDPANKREDTAQLREGLTVEQSLRLLADGIGLPLGDLEAAVADPSAYGVPADSLEGWLFPATYTFDPEVTASQVIRTLVDRTRTSLDAAGVAVADRQQILTVASIIQREARLEDDFYKVSRVIGNRLADGMKLQMDSTAQFGFDELHDGTASSSAEALADQNPWNTYVVDGLPAGPISNPGDIAIDAAMHPADGNWLYFVTWNMDTGETIFSDTYAEHEKAIAQWDQWCAVNDNRGC
ncbi:endolytic transglycosylase MltG [Microbacterium sp.]|uniref:endolytic transglycosylase MltG n=1 Tax=Microbacterium sp. TaxID=51671 RepID=UPI0025FF93BE|nr:endolytic transglycosylase MltG [Microbacterium sp.]